MFASNVDLTSVRNALENPHGAEIIAFNLSDSFQSHAGLTKVQPVRLSLGL
ncbi:MAG: hypothetical protein KA155_09425 [Alphaproteobacteria bacterium]|jgi:hypothetical protein|nr:hypothetical protein [Alphaproteobacteria bacterium]